MTYFMKKSLCVLFLYLSWLVPVSAQTVVTAENVEKWADQIFGKSLSEKRFSGAAITVVKGDKLIFSKGYGFADYAQQTPMDPASTKIRICSNSKTIVATGLMQLIERGQIRSLDDPANMYLRRIQLPDFAGKSVTVRDLVTHRAGLEDSYFHAATEVPVQTPLSAEIIERLIPKIVRKPGSLSVYSNATLALQGVMIEDITGTPLPLYLQENIFQPLGMTHSSLNISPPFPDGHAQPYSFTQGGDATPVKIVAKHPLYAPSGGVFSTAEDMSRFIRAHLTHGKLAEKPILTEESFSRMHQPLVRNHAGLPAIGVNFFIEKLNNRRFISHGCGLPGFTTYLAFIPELDIGVFISVISKSRTLSVWDKWFTEENNNPVKPVYATKFCYDFLRQFVGFNKNTSTLKLTAEDAGKYTGRYFPDRRIYSNMLMGLDLFFGDRIMIDVGYDGEGALTLNNRGPYTAQGNDIFRRGEHPAHTYAFDMDDAGQAVRLLRYGTFSATKVSFWHDPGVLRDVVGILSLVILSGLACWFYKGNKAMRMAPTMALLLFGLIFGLLTLGFAPGMSIEYYINNGHTLRLWLIALGCNLLLACGLVMVWESYRAWGRERGLFIRLHYILLTLSMLGLIPVMVYFNLIGFQIP